MHLRASNNRFNLMLIEWGVRNEFLPLSQILKTKSIESIHKLKPYSKPISSNLWFIRQVSNRFSLKDKSHLLMAIIHNRSHNCLTESVISSRISRQVAQARLSKDHLSRFTRSVEGPRKRRALNLSGTQELNSSSSSLRILRPRAYLVLQGTTKMRFQQDLAFLRTWWISPLRSITNSNVSHSNLIAVITLRDYSQLMFGPNLACFSPSSQKCQKKAFWTIIRGVFWRTWFWSTIRV